MNWIGANLGYLRAFTLCCGLLDESRVCACALVLFDSEILDVVKVDSEDGHDFVEDREQLVPDLPVARHQARVLVDPLGLRSVEPDLEREAELKHELHDAQEDNLLHKLLEERLADEGDEEHLDHAQQKSQRNRDAHRQWEQVFYHGLVFLVVGGLVERVLLRVVHRHEEGSRCRDHETDRKGVDKLDRPVQISHLILELCLGQSRSVLLSLSAYHLTCNLSFGKCVGFAGAGQENIDVARFQSEDAKRDELGHTNAPHARHSSCFQEDVGERFAVGVVPREDVRLFGVRLAEDHHQESKLGAPVHQRQRESPPVALLYQNCGYVEDAEGEQEAHDSQVGPSMFCQYLS